MREILVLQRGSTVDQKCCRNKEMREEGMNDECLDGHRRVSSV